MNSIQEPVSVNTETNTTESKAQTTIAEQPTQNEKSTSIITGRTSNGNEIYTNKEFGIANLEIPTNYVIRKDAIRVDFSDIPNMKSWYELHLRYGAAERNISLHINPDGFGPVFADESATLSLENNRFVVSDFARTNDKNDPDFYTYVVTSEKALENGHRYYWVFSLPMTAASTAEGNAFVEFLESIVLE